MGYKRENGRVGVRNHVVILPVDDISNACVEAIGNNIKGTTAIDFRSENLTSFDSLEKNSLDLYSSYKSVYLQNRENKIKNSTSDQEDWDTLDK